MVWFKVDDKLHSNSKVRMVLADDPAALALWVVAGSWCSDNLTDGIVPDHQLPWLLPSGAEELARKLVTTRLWRRVRGGYQFHEWAADGDGTKRNPTRAEVEAERRKKSEAGKKGGVASGKSRSRPEAGASAGASGGGSARATKVVEPPTRPDPTTSSGTGPYVSPGRNAREPDPPPNDETPSRVELLLTEYRDLLPRPLASGTAERFAMKLNEVVTDGFTDDEIRLGLAEMRNRKLGPSLLPDLVSEVANRPQPVTSSGVVPFPGRPAPGVPRPSTTDQRVATGLALAAKFDAVEAMKSLNATSRPAGQPTGDAP